MGKNLKILIVLIIVSTISVFIVHEALFSDQKIKYNDNKRYVVLPTECDNSLYPIQNLDRETLLKLLTERIVHFEVVEDIKKKNYINEIALRAEITKDKPDKKIIAELNKKQSVLNSDMNKINLAHKNKLNKILNVDSKGFIGRGPILPSRF